MNTPQPLSYDAVRVEGAKTLGDAYRHHKQDPEVFVAGTQYALDRLLQEAEFMGVPLSLSFLDSFAARTLQKAKDGEPQ